MQKRKNFKSKKALKNILQKCVHLPALEPLLHDAPPNILKHVVAQFSKVLPHDSKARRLFVTSGGLKKVCTRFPKMSSCFIKLIYFAFDYLKKKKLQEIKTEEGSPLTEYINTINNCYPEEIVK